MSGLGVCNPFFPALLAAPCEALTTGVPKEKLQGGRAAWTCPFLFASLGGSCTSAKRLPPGCSRAFSQRRLNPMWEIFITCRTNLRDTSISSLRSGYQTGRALSLSSETSLLVPSNLLRGVPLFLKLLIVNNSDAFFSNSHAELHGGEERVLALPPTCMWVGPPFVTLLGLYFLKQGDRLLRHWFFSTLPVLWHHLTSFWKKYCYLDSDSQRFRCNQTKLWSRPWPLRKKFSCIYCKPRVDQYCVGQGLKNYSSWAKSGLWTIF